VSGPLNVQTVTADAVIAELGELRDVIAAVQINGKPLGNAVRFEPASRIDDPIEVIIAPPSFVYGSNGLGPSGMLVDVYVIAVTSDITVHNLIALERAVADAIDLNTDHTVRQSDIGSWRRGGTDLPAYRILVEAGLE
jgi:hypothetical protein